MMLKTSMLLRFVPAVTLALFLVSACGGSEIIAHDKGNGTFVEGSPCDLNGALVCGFTFLECDPGTKRCFRPNACTVDSECANDLKCRVGIHLCAVACFTGADYCVKGTQCETVSGKCVPDATPAERSCPANCTVGHQCCAGSCSGAAAVMPSGCCSCLPGEVSSAACGGRCGT